MKPSQAHKGKLYPCQIQNIKFFLALTTILFIIDPPKGYTQGNQAPGSISAGQPVADSTLSTQIPLKGLRIGDKIPDEVWNLSLQVVNHPGGKEAVTLSDFKGKLLILDFWATWCSPCIAAFPKLDSLQRLFKNQIQILLVTQQNQELVQSFFSDWEKVENTTPPVSVVGDQVLVKAFGHRYLPHYVWISNTGIVQAITGGEEIRADYIQAFLDGRILSLPVKSDESRVYDYDEPMLSGVNRVSKDDVLYHSVLTRYVGGIGGTLSYHSPHYKHYQERGKSKVIALNTAPLNLFRIAYGTWKVEFISTLNRVKLEFKDPAKLNTFTSPKGVSGRAAIEWLKKYGYCYELIVPPADSANIFKIMQGELKKIFPGIYAKVEKRKARCLVLKRTGPDRLRVNTSLSNSSSQSKDEENKFHFKIDNERWSYFYESLVFYWQLEPTPLIDETGYGDQKIDLEIRARMSDKEAVAKELRRYNIDVIEEERMVDMIIISDKPF